jgi:hypothetical protein
LEIKQTTADKIKAISSTEEANLAKNMQDILNLGGPDEDQKNHSNIDMNGFLGEVR